MAVKSDNILDHNMHSEYIELKEDVADRLNKKGILPLIPGQQNYDLNAWAATSASLENGDTIEVRRVFYEQPPAIARYFDPYAGTGTGVQSLLETFGFGQFSPGINFLLMPMNFDLQKIQSYYYVHHNNLYYQETIQVYYCIIYFV